MDKADNFGAVLDLLERALDRVPAVIGAKLKVDIMKLKEFIMDARSPRLMIVGRRGAGKSSLLNAIMGERVAAVGAVPSTTGAATWYTCRTTRGTLELLDTRGMGERTRPQGSIGDRALDEVLQAVDAVAPDAVLFLCKAKEVDARVMDDVGALAAILAHIRRRHAYVPPVVGVVTQVDELDPKSDLRPPYPRKQENIATAAFMLEQSFRQGGLQALSVIPTCAYAEELEGGGVDTSHHWNIDVLTSYLIEALPRAAQVRLARLSAMRSAQEKVCRTLVGATATVAAGIAAVPVPVADVFPITAAQVGMIGSIAYIAGRQPGLASAREFMVALGLNIGGAVALRELARALMKAAFPVLGLPISAGIAAGGTCAIGEAAIAYYVKGAGIDQARAVLREVLRRRSKQADGPATSGGAGEGPGE